MIIYIYFTDSYSRNLIPEFQNETDNYNRNNNLLNSDLFVCYSTNSGI